MATPAEQLAHAQFVANVMQGVGTVLLGMVAGYIAYRQWRTAHQRVILDLFDKRSAIYYEARDIIAEVMRNASAPTPTYIRYLQVIDKAQFLFGPEVDESFRSFYVAMLDLHLAESQLKAKIENHEKASEREANALEKLSQFHTETLPLIRPYLDLHQRMPVRRFRLRF
jgi:hypothetical protein